MRRKQPVRTGDYMRWLTGWSAWWGVVDLNRAVNRRPEPTRQG